MDSSVSCSHREFSPGQQPFMALYEIKTTRPVYVYNP